jgi:hypothetical protein
MHFKLASSCLLAASILSSNGAPVLHEFQRVRLTQEFWAEGIHFADFNRDGKMDVVYGPHWYAGPDFKQRFEYAPATASFSLVRSSEGGKTTAGFKIAGFEGALGTNNAYSENFLTFCYDFNGDGWPDILVIPHPGKEGFWYENPRGRSGHWQRHLAYDNVENESPGFGDITGDGKPEIICCSRGYIGYAQADWKHADAPWKFHAVTPKGEWQRYTHGLGYGDINGDGRVDIIEKDAWWEQPASTAGDPVWVRHPVNFGPGGAQMLVYDVNGDGLNDVITSLNAHLYGLAWFEQVRENGTISFRQHLIMGEKPEQSRYGVKFSEPHALALADMDGDGVMDLVTGKRFWAHGPTGDVEPNAPAVLYWFGIVRGKGGSVDFVPHLIDDNSGVGTQVTVGDLDGDGLPDVLVGNKKGAVVFLHKTRKVSPAAWQAAQPKPITQATP